MDSIASLLPHIALLSWFQGVICQGMGVWEGRPTLLYCSTLRQNTMNSSFTHVFTYSTLSPFWGQITHWLVQTDEGPEIGAK